jgi:hypothetical protein
MKKTLVFVATLAIAAPAQAATVITSGPGTTGETALYPTKLLLNTTGAADSTFLGVPDDTFFGLGGQSVVYDLEGFVLTDLAGRDFNVYEVDSGVVEFSSITVGVSSDGTSFFDVTSTSGTAANLAGDEAHGNVSFRRGYDISGAIAAGFSNLRYIRVDGIGTAAAGSTAGFDLDAVGVRHFAQVTAAVPEPSTWAMMLLGFGFVGGAMRCAKRRTKLTVSCA